MRIKLGFGLCLVLVSILTDCRSDHPPPIDVGTGDGFGGGDFVLVPGSPLIALCQPEEVNGKKGYYCPPTALNQAWITSQWSMARFASWCYGAPIGEVTSVMEATRRSIPGH